MTRQQHRDRSRNLLPLIVEEADELPTETSPLIVVPNDIEANNIMSSSDLNYSSNTNGGEEGIAPSAKKSKRQKVVAVAKRPLKAVGRFVGKTRSSKSNTSYGSVGGEDALDDEVKWVDDDEEEEEEDAAAGIPEMVGTQQRRESFLQRVNSYRSGASAADGTTPRRGRTASGDSILDVDVAGDQRDWVVIRLERYLRQIAFVLLAFIVGTYHAVWRKFVTKCLEYVTVAWVTCCVLWIMASTSNPPAAVSGARPRRPFSSKKPW